MEMTGFSNINFAVAPVTSSAYLETAYVPVLSLTPAGYVGIGTANPAFKLDTEGGQINSSGGYCINGTNCITAWPTMSATTWSAPQTFSANTNFPSGIWNSSGKVGIGTTNPGQVLTVNGNFSATASYTGTYTPDGLFGSTATPSFVAMPGSSKVLFGYSDAGSGEYVARIGFSVPYENPYGNGTNIQAAANASIGLEPLSGDMTIRGGASNTEYMRLLNTNGNVGIGTTTPGAQLEVNGSVKLTSGSNGSITFQDGTSQTTAFIPANCGADYAEAVDVTGDRTKYEPGDVLVIDPKAPGKFLKSNQAYSTLVAGIYSTKPGFVGRLTPADAKTSPSEVPMAMVGRVPTKVSAENGPIQPGDLLVASSRMGYAMKGTDRDKMLGAVVGKALGSLDSGTGVIEVLVTLQ
jgi:hypothetical protein